MVVLCSTTGRDIHQKPLYRVWSSYITTLKVVRALPCYASSWLCGSKTSNSLLKTRHMKGLKKHLFDRGIQKRMPFSLIWRTLNVLRELPCYPSSWLFGNNFLYLCYALEFESALHLFETLTIVKELKGGCRGSDMRQMVAGHVIPGPPISIFTSLHVIYLTL